MNNLTRTCSILGIALTMLTPSSSDAATIYANDWYAVTAGTSNSLAMSGTNSNTATLSYADQNAAGTYLWSYLTPDASPLNLLDGASVSFTAGMRVDFASASSSSAFTLRFGFFDTSTRATEAIFGTDRTGGSALASYRNGWTGGMTGTVSSGTGATYQRNVGDASGFGATSGTTSAALTDSVLNPSIADNTSINLSLNFTRSGNDLLVTGGVGSDSLAGTYVDYFASAYPSTVDAFGFYFSGAPLVNTLTLSNVVVSVVPEPSSVALLLGSIGLVALLKRKKLKAI